MRYAQHVAGTGARYTRANPPARLLVTVLTKPEDRKKLEPLLARRVKVVRAAHLAEDLRAL